MNNGQGNYEPGGMAMSSGLSPEEAALRNEQYQEHQRRLQEKYMLQHQQLEQQSTHPHDESAPYYTSQGQLIYPVASPCYDARPRYGLSDFELLETL
ncbi:hypothetical protein CPB97_000922, partial [Podila verticillata]